MAQDDLIKHSVTRNETDYLNNTGAGVIRFNIFALPGPAMVSLPSALPGYWSSERDAVLMQAYREGGMWADAVNIAVTRVATLGFDVKADVGTRVRRARELLNSDWYRIVGKIARDYVCRDNGGFIEIVRATKAYSSKVLGFRYLNASRCIRTGREDVPVLYIDLLGSYHELYAHQVAEFSDLPDDDWYGAGLSATSRAYGSIYEHAAVRAYFREKTTGSRVLALDFLGGVSDKQVQSGIKSAEASAASKGLSAFMGSAIVANPNNETPVSHVRVPLAELPDGFEQVAHTELMQIEFADALGLDPVDLNPRLIGNRALGAGSQAQVLDEKQNSKGLISLRQQLTQFLNDTERWHVLPGAVTFSWSERDLQDQAAKAGIQGTRAATRASQIASGEITAEQARQIAVDAGDLPESFIAVDETDEEVLSDEDKAEDSAVEQPSADAAVVPVVAPVMNAQKELTLALKATQLATVTAPVERRRGRIGAKEQGYLNLVTKEFDEFGRIWTIAARQEVPQADGEMNRSIRYAVKNKGTRDVTLELSVGNAARPDVAIRSILFGRKAFGPKNKKYLRFQTKGKTVFARAVSGTKANDWFGRSWKQVQPQLREMQRRIGNASQNVDNITVGVQHDLIKVGDIEGARVYNTAQSPKAALAAWGKKWGAKKK